MHWELPQPELVGGEEEELSEEALIEVCVRKDANEVLMKNGPDALRLCIDQAEPLPIRGLFRWALPFYHLSCAGLCPPSSAFPSSFCCVSTE